MQPTFLCPVCREQKSDGTATPCCQNMICEDCLGFGYQSMVEIEGSRCKCTYCMAAVTDPDVYHGRLDATAIETIRNALASGAVAAAVTTAADATIKENAWYFGAYTHSPGCGSMVQVIDGCDTLKCPGSGCGRQINITGGQPGEHTYYVEGLFQALAKLTGDSTRSAWESVRSEHWIAWSARYLDELVERVRAGSLDPSTMDRTAWGGFIDVLHARETPQATAAATAVDGTSLFALINSIGATSPDGAALSTHYHQVEQDQQLADFQRTRMRQTVAAGLSDQRVKELVRAKTGDNNWWTN